MLKTIKQDPHCTIGLEVEYRGIAVTLAQGQGRAPTGQAVPENGTCLAKNDLMHLEIEGDPNGQIGLEIVSGRLTKETVNDFLQATAMLRLSLNTHSPIPLSTYAIHDFQF
ncbi:hypothetical protein H6B51_10165 [Pseudoflavonifractor phocaeensis]|nr:hypothetical protein [Pseudoflavonifractor phocaeensis]